MMIKAENNGRIIPDAWKALESDLEDALEKRVINSTVFPEGKEVIDRIRNLLIDKCSAQGTLRLRQKYEIFVKYLGKEYTQIITSELSKMLVDQEMKVRHDVLFTLGEAYKIPFSIIDGQLICSRDGKPIDVILYSLKDLQIKNPVIFGQHNYNVVFTEKQLMKSNAMDTVYYNKNVEEIEAYKTSHGLYDVILEIQLKDRSSDTPDTKGRIIYFTEDGILNRKFCICDSRYIYYNTYIFDINPKLINADDQLSLKAYAFISLQSMGNHDTCFIALFVVDGKPVKIVAVSHELSSDKILILPAKISEKGQEMSVASEVCKHAINIKNAVMSSKALIDGLTKNITTTTGRLNRNRIMLKLYQAQTSLVSFLPVIRAVECMFGDNSEISSKEKSKINQEFQKIIIKGGVGHKKSLIWDSCERRTILRCFSTKMLKKGRPSIMVLNKLYTDHGL